MIAALDVKWETLEIRDDAGRATDSHAPRDYVFSLLGPSRGEVARVWCVECAIIEDLAANDGGE